MNQCVYVVDWFYVHVYSCNVAARNKEKGKKTKLMSKTCKTGGFVCLCALNICQSECIISRVLTLRRLDESSRSFRIICFDKTHKHWTTRKKNEKKRGKSFAILNGLQFRLFRQQHWCTAWFTYKWEHFFHVKKLIYHSRSMPFNACLNPPKDWRVQCSGEMLHKEAYTVLKCVCVL